MRSRRLYRSGYREGPAFKGVPGRLPNSMAGIIDQGEPGAHPPYGVCRQFFFCFWYPTARISRIRPEPAIFRAFQDSGGRLRPAAAPIPPGNGRRQNPGFPPPAPVADDLVFLFLPIRCDTRQGPGVEHAGAVARSWRRSIVNYVFIGGRMRTGTTLPQSIKHIVR